MYKKRYLEETVLETHKHFKVVYVGGPRQVGKTTMLQHIAKDKKISYISLDDLDARELAQRDPKLFLQNLSVPVFIDEVQYAPNLFPYIKMRVDATKENGQFWLSGSQHFSLMKGVQESLAGRVGILSLSGFSWAEEHNIAMPREPFTPNLHPRLIPPSMPASKIFERIFRGTFPAFVEDTSLPRERFFSSYVQTYLDRDVREIFGIEKMSAFKTFLGLAAARTGQVLNISALARDAGVSVHAAKSWLHILQAGGVVYLLHPYFVNISKRLIKAPKLYFLDTGLAAYLTRWPDAATLQHGAMAGPLFETYVVSEVIKSYLYRGLEPSLYYLRSQDGHEVDLLIEYQRRLYPIEIKLTAAAKERDAAGIDFFRTTIPNLEQGSVLCLTEVALPINRTTIQIPVTFIV